MVALVLIHRPTFSPDSSHAAAVSLSDTSTLNPTSLDATDYHEFQSAATSFTTQSFDPMHRYCVVFIILASGFCQYFVQGIMSELALGPLSGSEYKINLFWIQQCHLTIGTFITNAQPISHSVPAGSLIGRSSCYAPAVVSCLQRRWVSSREIAPEYRVLWPFCRWCGLLLALSRFVPFSCAWLLCPTFHRNRGIHWRWF